VLYIRSLYEEEGSGLGFIGSMSMSTVSRCSLA
ncbi:hypothetical protein AK812_SmicGene47756, partial [Symbiodinium microadriaticum]